MRRSNQTKSKKMVLSRTTLRNLQAGALGHVHGACPPEQSITITERANVCCCDSVMLCTTSVCYCM